MNSKLASLSSVSEYATPKNIAIGAGALTCLYALRELYITSQLPPGPWGLPLLGRLPWLDADHLNESEEEMKKKYGNIFSYRAGQRLMVKLCSQELSKEAFKEDQFSGRIMPPEGVKLADNCGMGFIEGKNWAEQRRVAIKILRDHGFGKQSSVDSINSEIDLIFESLQAKSQAVDTSFLFFELTNSVICDLLFNRRYANEEKRYEQLMKAVLNFFDDSLSGSLSLMFPRFSFLTGFLTKTKNATKGTLLIQKFAEEEIAKREAELHDVNAEPLCLCDSYIQERRRAEAKGDYETHKRHNLIRICVEMFLGGTDTTSRTLQWMMLYMSLNPEVQAKVQHEIDQVVGQQRRPEISDKSKLNFTLAVIDETLRKSSLAFNSLIHRTFTKTKFHGFTIPSDAAITAFSYGIHHDPEVWARPNDFYPEHFLDRDGKYTPSKNLIPFSIGKRICPAESLARLEIFLAFSALMQRYTVKLTDSYRDKIPEILRGKTTTLLVTGDHRIDFIRR